MSECDLENLMRAAQNGDLESVESLLDEDKQLVNEWDESGATAVHYAALNGHRNIVKLLVERGANVNSRDTRFGATPAGWAIEYIRELGGHLGIELNDFAYALQIGDVRWARRFLERFPSLRNGSDTNGTPFRELARESGNPEIVQLFEG